MTIMPFEGLMSETVEDVFGVGLVTEPTHSDADEAWYCENVVNPEAEQDAADWAEDTFDPDGRDFSDEDWRIGQDRWERAFWGD
jgi:hypothetical protein